MDKESVLSVIDEVMNNREIDSIRNAILAIRDKVLEIDDDGWGSNETVARLRLRGGELNVTSPYREGDTWVLIDTCAKVDSGIYGEIRYGRGGENDK